MVRISVEAVGREWARYLQLVEAGETVIVTRADQPIAEIKPVNAEPADSSRRPIGLARGAFVVPDDFDAPLPDAVLDAFEGR